VPTPVIAISERTMILIYKCRTFGEAAEIIAYVYIYGHQTYKILLKKQMLYN
jgi:hypothetical protein